MIPTKTRRLDTLREAPYGPGNSTPLNQDYARVKPSEVHIYIYVYTYAYTYIHIYIYIEREREREREI